MKKKRYVLYPQDTELVQLRRKVASYENDPERVALISQYNSEIAKKDAQIARLKESAGTAKEKHETQIASLKIQLKSVRDKNKELALHNDELNRKLTVLRRQREFICQQLKFSREEIVRLNGMLYEKDKDITEKDAIIESLKLRLNKASDNSSLPSSMDRPYHKRVNTFNSRVSDPTKTVGAQKGHKHHARKDHMPTNTVIISPTAEMLANADLYETNETVSKKLINLRVYAEVTNFVTPIYRNRITGARIHAPFPQGLTDEITYDSGIESLILWMTNYCNVSIRKTREFLCEITNGAISPSVGYINGLLKKFGKYSDSEYTALHNRLLTSPAMNLDSTACNINGKNKRIFVFTNGTEAYYTYRNGKSLEDLKNTPIDGYSGALIHDHETAFYHFGIRERHQECLAHILRYLKAAIDENPELTWHKKMHEFFTSLIQTYHTARDDLSYEDIIDEYNRILEIGRYEYNLHPPSKYLREGERLLTRLETYWQENFLFIKDSNISHTNNICERLLRNIKRKAKQAVAFRSIESVKALCSFASIIETAKMNGISPLSQISDILSR